MTNSEWMTPPAMFRRLDNEFHFDIDVAASSENTVCPQYFDQESNGLTSLWAGTCYMYPPYTRLALETWVAKAYLESRDRGVTVVGLLPTDTSTKWWHNYVMRASEVRLLVGRQKFISPKTGKPTYPPTFGTAVVVWKPRNNDLRFSSWRWQDD